MLKVIGIALIVVLFIGVLQIISEKTVKTSSSFHDNKQQIIDTKDADIKINAISFFAEYTACRQISSEENLVEDCLKKNSLVSKKMINKTLADGRDPVVCSLDLPASYSVSNVMINKLSTEADVVESFADTKQTVRVSFINENNAWKVEKVSCPKV